MSSQSLAILVSIHNSVEIQLWARGDLDVELTAEQLFTAPSIRDLAIAIDQSLAGKPRFRTRGNECSLEAGRWVICPQPRPEVKLRLFCFPYAGGSASAFKSWTEALTDHIELCVFKCRDVRKLSES